jgi:hypothetical protein
VYDFSTFYYITAKIRLKFPWRVGGKERQRRQEGAEERGFELFRTTAYSQPNFDHSPDHLPPVPHHLSF